MAEYATNPDTSIARGAVNAIGGMGVKVPSYHGYISTDYATTTHGCMRPHYGHAHHCYTQLWRQDALVPWRY